MDDNFEYEEEQPLNIDAVVARFEEGLSKQRPEFFDVATYESLIRYYESRQRWQQALEVAECACAQHPFSPVFVIKKATFLLVLKKYEQAEALLDQAALLDPSDISVAILRSDMYLQTNRKQQAISCLEKAIETTDDLEDREELLLELADIYEECDEFELLYSTLERVLKLNPRNQEALSRMWYAVELSGYYEESIRLHQWVIDQDPYSYLAWHNLGNAYYDLGRYHDAIEAFGFATAINEDWDLSYRDCGDAYLQLKQYRKAIEQFELAIKASKPYEELLCAIGFCYEKLKEYERARGYYRKAIQQDPRHHEAYFRYGETYRKERNWGRAIQYYKKALRIQPARAEYLVALAGVYQQIGDGAALVHTSQLLAQLEVSAKTKTHYEKVIHLLIEQQCYQESLELLDHVTAELGTLASFPYLRAAALVYLGRRREGLGWLELGLSRHFRKVKVFFRLCPHLRRDPVIVALVQRYVDGA
ncbi:MAG: tetratricopeptide repeat protein [Chitinophagales bacterium]|nr:tetratricopeptide repeat protein [Chitinophagales bacterium]MDW8428521.1 tetratricopeptide repeat protein [Chitinophagales bacterium]